MEDTARRRRTLWAPAREACRPGAAAQSDSPCCSGGIWLNLPCARCERISWRTGEFHAVAHSSIGAMGADPVAARQDAAPEDVVAFPGLAAVGPSARGPVPGSPRVYASASRRAPSSWPVPFPQVALFGLGHPEVELLDQRHAVLPAPPVAGLEDSTTTPRGYNCSDCRSRRRSRPAPPPPRSSRVAGGGASACRRPPYGASVKKSSRLSMLHRIGMKTMLNLGHPPPRRRASRRNIRPARTSCHRMFSKLRVRAGRRGVERDVQQDAACPPAPTPCSPRMPVRWSTVRASCAAVPRGRGAR